MTTRDIARYRASHRKQFAGMGAERANRRIRGLLRARREQLALGGFIVGFRERYRAITWCAVGYAIDECGAIVPPSR